MSVLPKRPKIKTFICLVLDEQFANTFFPSFCLHPGHRNNMEEKLTEEWVGLFMEKADGANFISVRV